MMSSTNNILAGKSSSAAARKPQEPPVKCPRCDSPNTKFCYYNNYSLTQPRHFCKTCRRYWTKGGALRNVPIGGGCRKNKKTKPSSSSASADSAPGLPFFQGLTPAMDFQLSAINNAPDIDIFNHFSSPFGSLPPATGFSFPSHKVQQDRNNGPLGFQEMGSMNNYDPVAPLSSINIQPFVQKPQPTLFQNLENSNTGSFLAGTSSRNGNGNLSTELFFNNSYSYATAAPPTPVTNSSYNWSGSNQAWTELTHFASLP